MEEKPIAVFLMGVALVTIGLVLAGEAHAIKGDAAPLGKVIYKRECAICHGIEGKGDGPAASFLKYPKPRDFTKGVYKVRSTSSLPTDQDLFQTINKGIPGTLMPSFAYLSSKEQWDLVAYVKSFSEKFQEAERLEPIVIPEPPPQTQELIASGEKLYRDYGCAKCHGSTGKGDGPSAATLKDEWGEPIVPYDFTIPGKMKGGSTAKDIYRALAVGIGGTPMPAYGEPQSKEHENIYWALSAYVLSLTGETPPKLAGDSVLGKDLFTGVRRFKNGGVSCMSCHSIEAPGARGVGSFFGPDLTPAHSKFGEEGITTILSDLPFPTMNGVFSKYSLTPEEMNDLISFLETSSLTEQPARAVRELRGTPAYFAATAGSGVLAVIFLTIIGLRSGSKKLEWK